MALFPRTCNIPSTAHSPVQPVWEDVVTAACLAMTAWCHAGLIKEKGRIAIAELAVQSNRLVDLESKQVR